MRWPWELLWVKQIFCKHENQLLGEHFWNGEHEIFCYNCHKVLILSRLYKKMRLSDNRFNVGPN